LPRFDICHAAFSFFDGHVCLRRQSITDAYEATTLYFSPLPLFRPPIITHRLQLRHAFQRFHLPDVTMLMLRTPLPAPPDSAVFSPLDAMMRHDTPSPMLFLR